MAVRSKLRATLFCLFAFMVGISMGGVIAVALPTRRTTETHESIRNERERERQATERNRRLERELEQSDRQLGIR